MVKEKLRSALFKIYNERGYDDMVEVAKEILASNTHKNDAEFRMTVHGEVSEVVLECALNHYIKEHHLNWRVSKGMILRDPEGRDNKFSTELDLTLFTDENIVIFECKSYAGEIIIKGKGVVYRGGKPYRNVYEQNCLHRDVLWKTFKPCYCGLSTKKFSGVKIAFYQFAKGKTVDERPQASKEQMPLLETTNLFAYLDLLRSSKTVRWKRSTVNRFLDIIEANNSKRTTSHVNYVKSLHSK